MIAIWCPNGRERCSTRTRSSAAATASRISAVPSVEPSSTTISSNGTPSSVATTREQNSRASPSSSSIGATTLNSRNSRIGASLAAIAVAAVVPGHAECEHVFDVRRAPRPLRLLVPGRRLAARRAGGRGRRAGLRGDGADRPQLGLGLDGVRPGGGRARAARDPRGGGRPRRRAPPHAAGRGRGRLAQPVPDPHPRAPRHAPEARAAAGRAAGDGRGARRRAWSA